jgi:predicted esterase
MGEGGGRDDPHGGQPVLAAGAPLAGAPGAVVLIHGRGATPEDILALAGELGHPELAYLAPRAAGQTWYPHRFLEPLARNEPYLSSALGVVGRLVAEAAAAGVAAERVVLLGFSQGACLALEFGARHARRYGGLVGLSGGLIGPEGTPRDHAGSLAGTPVFLGCSDVDFHIPKERVVESAEVLEGLGGEVDLRLYPGMGHTVNRDEIAAVRALLDRLGEPAGAPTGQG